MRKRAYRSTSVKRVKISQIRDELSDGPLWAGVDVGKKCLLLVCRDVRAGFSRPWKAKQPEELGELVSRIVALSETGPLVVAMESTGTYGDALRQALTDRGVSVERVSGKASHDYAEIFDGVPSAHDGKDAAVIAELAAIGKSTPWPYEAVSEEDGELARWVDWMDAQQDILEAAGTEDEGQTIVEFRIALDSGDSADKPLLPGESYPLLVAFHATSDSLSVRHTHRATAELTLD